VIDCEPVSRNRQKNN